MRVLKHFFLTTAILTMAPTLVVADSMSLKDTVPHITTTGTATVDVVPDQADISVGVSNERPTAADAAATTAKAATDVIASIKAHGIDAQDIKTSFSMSAQYDEVRSQNGREVLSRTLRGYVADEYVVVRVHDVSRAGALARDFIEKGANDFRGIFFSYSKEAATRRDLKATSMRDALAAAKIYTEAIGLKLGRVLQIGDDPLESGEADLPSRVGAPGTSKVVIPTEPGIESLHEDIKVIWEIEGNAP